MASIGLTSAPAGAVTTPAGSLAAPNNFANLTTAQAAAWSMQVWKTVRQKSFIMASAGSTFNSAITRITELTNTGKGTQAILTLVPDLTGEGVNGNGFMEGREEAVDAIEQSIVIDHLRNANKSKGRMSEQATVVNFRATSRDLLSYWLADSIDQLGSTQLGGFPSCLHTNGKLRASFTGSTTAPVLAVDPDLAFAGLDFMLGDAGVVGGARALAATRKAVLQSKTITWGATGVNNGALLATDTVSYDNLVDFKAYIADRRLRAISGDMGTAVYHVLVHPKVMAALKKDANFLGNVRQGMQRGASNPLFTGAIPTIDGMVFHEWTHAFNTLGATSDAVNPGNLGVKWGDGTVDGSRIYFLGGQALGIADLGTPSWDERDHFDYGDKPGIAVSKMFGMLRPQFPSAQDNGTVSDYGVATLDVAI